MSRKQLWMRRWRETNEHPFRKFSKGCPVRRFWENVQITEGCWIWEGHVSKKGYPTLGVMNKPIRVNRFAYEQSRGPIPKGLVLDHLCRNIRCVNPYHLEPVTDYVNVIVRGTGITAQNAAKRFCIRGHEFTPENTRHYDRRKPHARQCFACAQIRDREVKRKRRESRIAGNA